MADFQGVLTTAGKALDVQNRNAGLPTVIDRIEVGQNSRTPTVDDTGVVTPFTPPKSYTDPAGLVTGNELQMDFSDDTTNEFDVREVVAFSGSVGVFSFSALPGPMFTKVSNLTLVLPLIIRIEGAPIDNISFNVQAIPQAKKGGPPGLVGLATDAQAADVSNLPDGKVPTFRQISIWWQNFGTSALQTINNRLGVLDGNVATLFSSKANQNNTRLTGNPTAPTPGALDRDTSIATTEFVNVLRGERRPTSSDGVDGSIWIRPSDGSQWIKGGGVWRKMRVSYSGAFLDTIQLDARNSSPRGASMVGSEVWITDGTSESGDYHCYRYNALTGAFIARFQLDDSRSDAPAGVTEVNGEGWITRAGLGDVMRYRLDGTYIADITAFDRPAVPRDIAFVNNEILSVASNNLNVYRYSLAGARLGSWARQSGNGAPRGIALVDGQVWILGQASPPEIFIYDTSGNFISVFSLPVGTPAAVSAFAVVGDVFWVTVGGNPVTAYRFATE